MVPGIPDTWFLCDAGTHRCPPPSQPAAATTTSTISGSNKLLLLSWRWEWRWRWWLVLDLRMVVGGLWYLVPVLLFDMRACVELDQLGVSATLLVPTVLVFIVHLDALHSHRSCIHSALTHTWLERLQQQQQYPYTHTLDLCSQLRTTAGTSISSLLFSNRRLQSDLNHGKSSTHFSRKPDYRDSWTIVALVLVPD